MKTNALGDAEVRLDCIAFLDGVRIPDGDLEDVVELAIDGYITLAGQYLQLIPRQHYEKAVRNQQTKADERARKMQRLGREVNSGSASPSIKKWDCIPLSNFLPKKSGLPRATLCENQPSNPLIPRPPARYRRNPRTLVHVFNKRNGSCATCGDSLKHKRRDAKFCGQACKQAAHRSRRRAKWSEGS